MKHLRKFKTVGDMNATITADYVSFVGMVKDDGKAPILHLHVHNKPTPKPPTNLVISCSENTVTITADNATTIEYKLSESGSYITYTEPFAITQTVTVYAKASNADGSITGSQECRYTVPKTTPFYVEDISGSVNTVQIKKNNSKAPTLTIEKSTDGITWETMGTTSTTGISARVPANGKLYLRCNATPWAIAYNYNTITTTGDCNVGGNTMSLLYGSNFTGNETTFPSGSTYTFNYLFYNSKIIKASELLLPATTLDEGCYKSMFQDCASLTTAPELPATTLASYCYSDMFNGCTSLTTAPAILPATTLANNCYIFMFAGCTSLTTAPALPATTLANYCYQSMFKRCTSLTTAPALPATTLANSCYYGMFDGCRTLTTAPALPATSLIQYCYYGMFYNCQSLNYIKCLATKKSATNCTTDWVNGVAATGTFVKNASMTSWTTGTSGIPSGWIVKDAGGISLSQNLNVATITISDLDEGTGYYTINGGSPISVGNGTTTIPITQEMNGQVLLVHGEFSGVPSEETLTLSWTDYSPSVTITETKNYVTINSPNADVIKYRLGSSGSFTTYTEPVYINENTTIYVQATKTVSGVDYTTNTSQEVTHEIIPPSNLVISCTNNFVTITATGADTLEYNMNGGTSFYTTYTKPFHITESGTVNARATNADGSITASQAVTYIDYRPTINITEANNFVTVTAEGANTILYRLGTISEYVAYTGPVYIAENTTIYVQATRTVAGVDYTSTVSQAVTHKSIPPTNLVISCASNKVTITADNATTIEYNFDGSSTYTTYTEPFEITQTVTVYAKASNVDGSITASQECEYQSGPDVPFAENLMFYAPLGEGDLTDHISNTSGSIKSGTTVTWDSSKGMYLFLTQGNGSGAGGTGLKGGLIWSNLINYTGSLTIYMHAEQVPTCYGNNYNVIGTVFNGANNGPYLHPFRLGFSGGGDGTTPRLESWSCNIAVVYTRSGSSASAVWYKDGVATKSEASWNASVPFTNVIICGNQKNNNTYRYYIKDVRVYNRAMSASEIAQLPV